MPELNEGNFRTFAMQDFAESAEENDGVVARPDDIIIGAVIGAGGRSAAR